MTFTSIDPATGETLSRHSEATSDEIEAALTRAQDAYLR